MRKTEKAERDAQPSKQRKAIRSVSVAVNVVLFLAGVALVALFAWLGVSIGDWIQTGL